MKWIADTDEPDVEAETVRPAHRIVHRCPPAPVDVTLVDKSTVRDSVGREAVSAPGLDFVFFPKSFLVSLYRIRELRRKI